MQLSVRYLAAYLLYVSFNNQITEMRTEIELSLFHVCVFKAIHEIERDRYEGERELVCLCKNEFVNDFKCGRQARLFSFRDAYRSSLFT